MSGIINDTSMASGALDGADATICGVSVSRRSLIGAAAMGAAIATLSTTRRAYASEIADKKDSSDNWDLSADVVVVGLGGAGAAAAVSALDAGASVIVLESEEQGGGCTAVSGGLLYLGGGTPAQVASGVTDTPENMKAYLTVALGPSADANLVDIFCNNSVDAYDWLVDHGVTFDGDAIIDDHVITAPEGIVLTYSGNERARAYAAIADPAPRGHTPNGGGLGVMEALTAILDASDDAQILYQTRGTDLVTDETGTVVGVTAEDADGAEIRVGATQGVILTAGAFTYNDDLLADYAPEALRHAGRTGLPSDRGDGILMGMRIGAATRSMSRLGIWQFMYGNYGDLVNGVLLDQNGLRFIAEDSYGSWIGRTISQYTPDVCYAVVDDEAMQTILASPYGAYLPKAVSADTLEELLGKIDIPAANALASVERYNKWCDAGEDADFGKDPSCLKAISTAPFYAIDANAANGWGSPLTCGGLKINVNAEVVDRAGDPIPGLYAAGRNSCGIFGEYPGSGTSIADCVIFGRIAGEQAAAR